MSATLYRHRDAYGELLYIGVSLRPLYRTAQHAGSSWFPEIVQIDLVHFPDMKSARQAERTAIAIEKPKYNKQGTERMNRSQTDRSALQKAVAAVGSITALAQRLGISKQAVSMWTRVPAERAQEIEAVTGVPRHILRPDLWERAQ